MARRGRTGSRYRRLRQHVQQRDRVCWICGDPIPTDVSYPHPLSFTVDHVEPLAQGGDLLDPRNARGAHLACNSQRGSHQHATAAASGRRKLARSRPATSRNW